jgi:FkbM family methyltransferase
MMRKLLRVSANLVPWSLRTKIHNVPLIAPLQRWCLNRALGGKSFVHQINAGPARGLKMEVTFPQDKPMWAGTYEIEFAEELSKNARPGVVCFDIGGYRGYMAGVLALAGASRVFTFEPMPANAAAIKQLIALNSNLPIELVEFAAGDRDAQIGFYVMPDASMGKLATSAYQRDVTGGREIVVQVRRIDSVVFDTKLPPPDLIKIDVEGAEVEVLKGASRTLGQFHPRIFIEAHSEELARACLAHLAALGYTVDQLEHSTLPPNETRHLIAR